MAAAWPLDDADLGPDRALPFRESAITCPYRWFAVVLNAFGEHEHMLFYDLARKAGISEQLASRVLHDAVILGLVQRVGVGWLVTREGRRWRTESLDAGVPSMEFLRQCAAAVPLFKLALHDLPGVDDRRRIDAYFAALRVPDALAHELSSARQRYLEAFYDYEMPGVAKEKIAASIPASVLASMNDTEAFIQFVVEYNKLLRKYPAEFLTRYHDCVFPTPTDQAPDAERPQRTPRPGGPLRGSAS